MTIHAEYLAFLEAKAATVEQRGFHVEDSDINPILKPHQKAAVRWALRGDRRAIFARFGLGKTVMQLEVLRLILIREGGRALITAPLGVRQEFMHDVRTLATGDSPDITDAQRDELRRWQEGRPDRIPSLKFIRSVGEADATGIHLTNYETVRDGKLDPREFMATSLDEAACLRGFGGTKTFREFMKLFADDDRCGPAGEGIKYRFVATATPSPNEFLELLAYAAFLGVMDVGEGKTRFFKRNSEKADQLTIHPHKVEEFWLWVGTWALFLQRPSDLGYSDEGYDLPPVDLHWHEVSVDHRSQAGEERNGQRRMFADAAISAPGAAKVKRDTLPDRLVKLQELRAIDPDAHRIIWHDLEAEREAIERVLPSARWRHWEQYRDGHPKAVELYDRHYSARTLPDRDRIVGPGERMVLLTGRQDALFVWRKFIDDSGERGINCAVFRNEGATRASELIREAMAIAWERWPGERLYTYVDAAAVRSTVPGYCFRRAGWKRSGTTKGGLIVLEALPSRRVALVARRPGLVSVYGNQDLDEREQSIIGFSAGEIQELAGKPVMLGSGCNFQRHCAWAIYLGIGFKFAEFIQSYHRLVRFLQTRQVRVDIIYSEAERGVRRTLERKWKQHNEMVEKMTEIIRKYGLSDAAMADALKRSIGVERVEVSGENWRLVNEDSVIETKRMESASVGLIVTSIPFSTQYEYTPLYNDFGHSDDDAHFWRQMDFLTPELFRILEPGRICAVHVKDRIVPGGINGLGFQTINPLSDDCIRHFRQHGFAFMARKTVVTDVVRENSQTYRLGWTEQCKDGSKMGAGMPEYVLLFRKPPSDSVNSYADRPVVKAKKLATRDGWDNPDGYSRARWQLDAHGFTRSSGNRLLKPEDLEGLAADQVYQAFRAFSITTVYDFEHHVRIAEALELRGNLPPGFMLLPPQSAHPDVLTDVVRMRTLNTMQAQKGQEQHLCPLPLDLVERLINQLSMPSEVVFDPFSGLGSVPYQAVLQGRIGWGIELSHKYFVDACHYLRAAEEKVSMPNLFDLIEVDTNSLSPEAVPA